MAPLPLSAQLRAAGSHLQLDRVCDCRLDLARSWIPAVHLDADRWNVLGRPDDPDYFDRDWAEAQAWIVERVLPGPCRLHEFIEDRKSVVGKECLWLCRSRWSPYH